jgi:DNA-binding XRE family transcriptional regulator
VKPFDHDRQRHWYRPGAPEPYDREPSRLAQPSQAQAEGSGSEDTCRQLDPVEPEPYSALLRTLRRRAGRTQWEMAEAAGLCPNTIVNLERGHIARPRRSTHDRLVAALRAVPVVRDDVTRLEGAYCVARWRCRDVALEQLKEE